MAQGCDGKITHSTFGSAVIAVERMEAKTNEAFNAYKCRECTGYHIGHTQFLKGENMAATKEHPPGDGHNFEEGGEVMSAADVTSTLAIAKGEIDQQIATAKRYPRSIKQFIDTATELVTLDEETAEECIYALPRDGKTIEGPSARFAEILAYAWGNCRAGARMVGEDNQFVRSQGVYYDLEKNVGIQFEVSRRIVDKNNRRFKPDMIGTTANAAGSIALRNAVLKGIPKAFWKKPYERARAVVAGDFKTLANRRAEALKQFAVFGVTPEMIFTLMDIKGVEDVTLDHMVTLKGILTAIREGDTTPEQVFAPPVTSTTVRSEAMGDATAKRGNDLDQKYRKPSSEPEPAVAASSDPPQGAENRTSPSPTPQEQTHRRTVKPLEQNGETKHGERLDFQSRGVRNHFE